MTPETLRKILDEHMPHADAGTATHLLEACKATGLAISDALALIEKESGGQNVFGHDGTSSIPERWKGSRVTWAKYRYYKLRRKSRGAQGVGPCQLTWPGYQDQADAAGGCHKPGPNMLVGFKALHALIATHGRFAGAAAYNGTGPLAQTYGRDFVKRQRAWHERIT
jgi:hypothetical protein